MIAPAHLTDEQFARYRNRTLPTPELLAADAHLAECPECRSRAYAESNVSNGIRALRTDLTEHLDYAGIVSCSEGGATPEQRTHLAECAGCRSEVQDLSRFRTEMYERPRQTRPSRSALVMPLRSAARWKAPAAIAASVVLVAAGAVWMSRSHRAEVAPATETAKAEPSLPPAEHALLDRAVASKRFDRAPVLERLLAKPGTLLGSNSSAAVIRLLSPVGTTVVTDRPDLRWTPTDGATSYVVSIFDEHFNKVAESPVLHGVDWEPASPLPREKVLIWQVTATTAKGQVRAPQPPAPEARFEIVSAATAARIDQMRREHPGDALLLATLYANAGALDAATEALRAMDPAAAERYQESIAKIRRGE